MGERRMASIFPECDELKQMLITFGVVLQKPKAGLKSALECASSDIHLLLVCRLYWYPSLISSNYDKCFTEFFQKFITPNYRHKYAVNPCDGLHQAYRECVEQRLAKDRPFEIDLAEVQKEFLNTEGDKLKGSQEEK